MKVLLKGGPFDGAVVEPRDKGAKVILEGPGVPEGRVARYGPSRIKDVYLFRGLDRVVIRVAVGKDE